MTLLYLAADLAILSPVGSSPGWRWACRSSRPAGSTPRGCSSSADRDRLRPDRPPSSAGGRFEGGSERPWWRIVILPADEPDRPGLPGVNPYGLAGVQSTRSSSRDDEQPELQDDRRADAARSDFIVRQDRPGSKPAAPAPHRGLGPRPASASSPRGLARVVVEIADRTRIRDRGGAARPPGRGRRRRRKAADSSATGPDHDSSGGPRASFRLLLFVAFGSASLEPGGHAEQPPVRRRSPGAVTAWNFAEWAAAIRNRRARDSRPSPAELGVASDRRPSPG